MIALGLGSFVASISAKPRRPLLGAIAVACLATLMVGRKAGGAYRDGLLGAIFLLGGAGTLLVATQIPNELHDIEALLKGEGVAVLPEDFALVAKLCGFVILAHIMAWRGFVAVSFDPLGAEVRRVPVRFFELLLAVTLAVGIAAGIRVLGPLPVFGLSVMPALAATRLGRNIPQSLAIGAVLAIVAGVYGYIFAYLMGFGVGASQTGVALALALLVELALRLPSVGSPRLFRLAQSRAAPWVPRVARALGLALLVAAIVVGLRPLRQGIAVALDLPMLGEPAWELGLGVVGLGLALVGLWLAWKSHERGVVSPGIVAGALGLVVLVFCWQDAPGWTELVRPLVLAAVLAGLAACMREVAHRLELERAVAV